MTERCCEASEAAGESLAATAVSARAWLVVEVPGAWPRDVSKADALPPVAAQGVARWIDENPGSRLQFVRRPGRSTGGHRVFVARSEEHECELTRFELDSLDELGTVDLAAEGEPVDGSLVLVCAHGTRDQCCSLRGTAVFGELARHLPDDELWISSHLGGHRFAANVLVLPAGLQFGRVTPPEARQLVSGALEGRIELARYRGRTCHAPAVQAADYAVRVASRIHRADDLELVGHENGVVRLRSSDGREWTVRTSEVEGPPVPASCGNEPAPQFAYEAEVLLTARAGTPDR